MDAPTTPIARRSPLGKYYNIPWNWRASMAYVTGAHSVKVGYQGAYFMYDRRTLVNEPQMRYTFSSSRNAAGDVVPNPNSPCRTSLTPGFDFSDRTEMNAIYVQGSIGRWAAEPAGRAALRPRDGLGAGDKQSEQTSRFNPQPIRFDTTDSITGYNDINTDSGSPMTCSKRQDGAQGELRDAIWGLHTPTASTRPTIRH
jgi:hypothetical protein